MCYTVKSIDDVRSLVAAARGLAGLVDIDALVSNACRQLNNLVGKDFAAVAVCDRPDAMSLRVVEGLAWRPPRATYPRGQGLGWEALELRDTSSIDLVEGHDYSDPFLRAAAREGIRTIVACPIEFTESAIGALYVGSRTPGEASDLRTSGLLWEFAASLAPLMVTALRASRAGELAVQEERARIAQHLHDTAGQLLFSIGLISKELQDGGYDDPEAVITAAKAINEYSAAASVNLREAMHSMLPARGALPVAVRRDVDAFYRRSGTPAEAIVLGQPADTSDYVDETVLTALREGLHNVERHASASSVSVTLTYRPMGIALLIQDDGHGLDVAHVSAPLPGKARGLGLPGLVQRLRAVDGQLSLRNSEDGGASLLITIPLEEAA